MKHYNKEEIYNKIKDVWDIKSNEELATLCNCSLSTIKRVKKAYNLKKIHSWTEEEINFIKSNINTMSNEEIANSLNLSLDTVKMKIRTDNIKREKFKEIITQLDDEIWKPIAFTNNYSVSNLGRIKNNEGYLLQLYINKNGYVNVSIIDKNGSRKQHRLHRLVAEAFIENPDNKPEVNHIDGNKLNNSVINLEWVTRNENILHAWNTGLIRKDFQTEKVIKVCEMLVEGKSYNDISKETGLSKNAIGCIKRRKTWKDISKNYKW